MKVDFRLIGVAAVKEILGQKTMGIIYETC